MWFLLISPRRRARRAVCSLSKPTGLSSDFEPEAPAEKRANQLSNRDRIGCGICYEARRR
jgi:hypothetical protein